MINRWDWWKNSGTLSLIYITSLKKSIIWDWNSNCLDKSIISLAKVSALKSMYRNCRETRRKFHFRMLKSKLWVIIYGHFEYWIFWLWHLLTNRTMTKWKMMDHISSDVNIYHISPSSQGETGSSMRDLYSHQYMLQSSVFSWSTCYHQIKQMYI